MTKMQKQLDELEALNAEYLRQINASFGQRRKTLKNALVSRLSVWPQTVLHALMQAGIDPARRAETLSPEEFVALEISLHRVASDSDAMRSS